MGKINVKGGINRYRDLIYIDDIVEAWYGAATYDSAKNQVFNLGTGRKTTVGRLLNMFFEIVPNSTYQIIEGTPGDQNGIYADNTKLKTILMMDQFVEPEKGISIFAKWAKNKINN